jgi:predicted Zn-dependent protease
MRQLLFITLFFISLVSICQEKEKITSSIDSIVDSIDLLQKTQAKSYSNEKIIKKKKIAEAWRYFNNKKFWFISIEYKIDSTAYTEEYYLQNGAMIYAYESEIRYFPSLGINEYSVWSGSFYFVKDKLIDHVTLGHRKSETDDWDPEKEILQRLKKRKAELSLLLK